MPARWLPSLATLIALTLGLMVWTEDADARLGDGQSFAGASSAGSFAIDSIVAFDNSLLPAAAPTYPGGSLGGLFSRPLSGVASVLGLMFQLALLAMLARLIWTWWHDDKTGARAGLSPRQLADAYGRPRKEVLPDIDAGANFDPAFDETADDGLDHPK
jgi:hypothetical protein